jgi:acyl-CoA synthetase (AMP-forming)/AMP-acid ligase II/AcrR family transcriptional regulator
MVTGTVDSPWRSRRERQPERVAKTEAVLLAAARLFTKQGFQGTSLDDIARSLGVTKPTLYYYITSKEQILFACVERGVAELRAGLAALAAQALEGRERLRAAMRLYADIVTSDWGLCVIRVGEDPLPEPRRIELRALKGQVDAEFRTLIEQGMHEGWIAEGDAAVAAFTVVGALSGIGRWYRPESHSADNLQDAVNHCIEMLMRGVLGAPAAAPTPPLPAADGLRPAQRRERHFDDRLLRCFVPRPPHVAQMLVDALTLRPDGEALVCGELRLSWRELHHAATKCAGGLAQRGVAAGDRVALHLGNVPEFVVATLACAWMGAVLVPVAPRASAAALAFALEDSGASALISAESLVEQLPLPVMLPQLHHRFVVGATALPGFEPFAELMRAPPMAQPHAAQADDLAALLYTSGTTGQPKGAMVTQLNIVHSVMHFAQAMGLGESDRSVLAVPLSHVTGLVAQLYSLLYARGCMVLMPQFRAADFVRLAEAERMSCVILVPAMYNLCLLLPDLASHALDHWRIGAYGGAAMPTATIEGLAQRLPGLVLMNAYGATETCSPATIMPAGQTARHGDSVGQVVACGELCVVDEHDQELPPGGVGELWIAGPMVVPGYWRNPAATAREFCGGFWRSGDIGSIDAEGYVRILDRKKDLIIRGGYKVFCVAVENTLAEHPQVVEAALVGVPCAVLGERVHAHVCVRQLDERTSAQALRAFCAQRLADYAVPETWTIGTEPLPRNANGKLMKRELRRSLNAALT